MGEATERDGSETGQNQRTQSGDKEPAFGEEENRDKTAQKQQTGGQKKSPSRQMSGFQKNTESENIGEQKQNAKKEKTSLCSGRYTHERPQHFI